jgi:hypothetical protein
VRNTKPKAATRWVSSHSLAWVQRQRVPRVPSAVLAQSDAPNHGLKLSP